MERVEVTTSITCALRLNSNSNVILRSCKAHSEQGNAKNSTICSSQLILWQFHWIVLNYCVLIYWEMGYYCIFKYKRLFLFILFIGLALSVKIDKECKDQLLYKGFNTFCIICKKGSEYKSKSPLLPKYNLKFMFCLSGSALIFHI